MNNNVQLENESPLKLLISLSIPAICASIVTLLYNMVDRIYIGRMVDGTLAMAGIGLCVPIVTVVSAFTGLFGRGGSPFAAIYMGKKDQNRAERYLGNSFICLLATSILITGIVLIFHKPLLYLFGASDVTYSYAYDYLKIYILGTAFIQLTVGINYYITTQGFARTAMMTTMLGGILNIVLDPIFIFKMNMGIQGAALATVLSQAISCIWVLLFIFGKKTVLKIKKANLKLNKDVMKDILSLGAAPFFMNCSEGLLVICFNLQVAKYGGDLAVSAMTVLYSIFNLILLPIEGIAQGSQPIISYNYGAEKYNRVKETLKYALCISIFYSVIIVSLMVIYPDFFIRIFNQNQELVDLGGKMLRVYIAGNIFVGANSTFQQTYNSLGIGKCALFFAFYRKIIILIPCIYLLPVLFPAWGIYSVMAAESVSDLVTVCTNAIYFRLFLKRKLS